MDILKHTQMLADGLGSDLLSEIRNEVVSFESMLKDLSISIQDLRPESQFALKRASGNIQDAERISATLANYEMRVMELQRNPGIREISDLEEQLRQTTSRNEMARLKRQILHAKSIHSRKLSDLISTQQQVLQERLRLINIWKSILNYEIHILEDCKNTIVKTIVAMANSSGDAETIEMVRERLRSLSVKDSLISEIKLDLTDLHVANIHVLHKALTDHLNEIQRIETTVEEKRQVVQVLSSIVKDIRNKLPSPPPEEPPLFPPSAARAAEPSKKEPPDSSLPSSSTRMTYQK